MKAAFLATAAAIAGTAIADGHVHRAHDALHHRRAVQAGGESVASEQQPEKRCGCETEVITYYGSPSCEYTWSRSELINIPTNDTDEHQY